MSHVCNFLLGILFCIDKNWNFHGILFLIKLNYFFMCLRYLYVASIMILTNTHSWFLHTHTHRHTHTYTHTRTHTFCSEMNGDKSAGTIVLYCNTSRECIYAFQSKIMSFFTVCNHWDNYLIFMFWIVLKCTLALFFLLLHFAWKKKNVESDFLCLFQTFSSLLAP